MTRALWGLASSLLALSALLCIEPEAQAFGRRAKFSGTLLKVTDGKKLQLVFAGSDGKPPRPAPEEWTPCGRVSLRANLAACLETCDGGTLLLSSEPHHPSLSQALEGSNWTDTLELTVPTNLGGHVTRDARGALTLHLANEKRKPSPLCLTRHPYSFEGSSCLITTHRALWGDGDPLEHYQVLLSTYATQAGTRPEGLALNRMASEVYAVRMLMDSLEITEPTTRLAFLSSSLRAAPGMLCQLASRWLPGLPALPTSLPLQDAIQASTSELDRALDFLTRSAGRRDPTPEGVWKQ